MQPENLIARAHSLLETAASVELGDFGWPGVTALDPRYEGLADVELSRDVLLHPPIGNAGHDSSIAGIQLVHSLALAPDDGEGAVGLLGLDRNVGPNGKQEALDIGSGRDGVAVKAPIATLDPALVFFNAPIAEPPVNGVEGRFVRVGEPQPNAAFILVDLDAAFPIKEARDVAEEGVVAEMIHSYALAHIRVSNKFEERIQQVEALASMAEAA